MPSSSLVLLCWTLNQLAHFSLNHLLCCPKCHIGTFSKQYLISSFLLNPTLFSALYYKSLKFIPFLSRVLSTQANKQASTSFSDCCGNTSAVLQPLYYLKGAQQRNTGLDINKRNSSCTVTAVCFTSKSVSRRFNSRNGYKMMMLVFTHTIFILTPLQN